MNTFAFIFKKKIFQFARFQSLRLAISARYRTNLGNMNNLLSSDANQFQYSCHFIKGVLTSPLQVAFYAYLLYQKIGIATFVGMATMAIFMPFVKQLAKFKGQFLTRQKVLTDERIKVINEILEGIRGIRFHGWELFFIKFVTGIRSKELRVYIKVVLVDIASGLAWDYMSFIVSCISFTVYLASNQRNNLDPNKAFVSILLFNMMKEPFNFLPYILNQFITVEYSV